MKSFLSKITNYILIIYKKEQVKMYIMTKSNKKLENNN